MDSPHVADRLFAPQGQPSGGPPNTTGKSKWLPTSTVSMQVRPSQPRRASSQAPPNSVGGGLSSRGPARGESAYRGTAAEEQQHHEAAHGRAAAPMGHRTPPRVSHSGPAESPAPLRNVVAGYGRKMHNTYASAQGPCANPADAQRQRVRRRHPRCGRDALSPSCLPQGECLRHGAAVSLHH